MLGPVPSISVRVAKELSADIQNVFKASRSPIIAPRQSSCNHPGHHAGQNERAYDPLYRLQHPVLSPPQVQCANDNRAEVETIKSPERERSTASDQQARDKPHWWASMHRKCCCNTSRDWQRPQQPVLKLLAETIRDSLNEAIRCEYAQPDRHCREDSRTFDHLPPIGVMLGPVPSISVPTAEELSNIPTGVRNRDSRDAAFGLTRE